jgi:DnaJ like chaperone protein
MTRGLIYTIAAILYVLFPSDLMPDFLAGWGWIDDLIVLFLLWRYYRVQSQLRRAESRSGQTRQRSDSRQSRPTGPAGRNSRDPYTVLEIEPGASREEIRAAYRRLAAQYHPDKVQHLGEELRELAETRFKDIQQAYDQLTGRAGGNN